MKDESGIKAALYLGFLCGVQFMLIVLAILVEVND